MRAGLGSPVTRPLYLLAANEAFFGGFFYALYYLFCIQVIGLSEAPIGLIVSVGGIGALVGSWGAGRFASNLGIGRALLLGTALAAISAMMLPAAGWASGPLVAIALLVGHQLVSDGFAIFSNVFALSLRQAALPPAEIGRANAAYHALVSGLTPIGALVSGPLAQATSIELAVLVGVSGGLLNPLIVATSRLHRLVDLHEPGDRHRKARTGRISIHRGRREGSGHGDIGLSSIDC